MESHTKCAKPLEKKNNLTFLDVFVRFLGVLLHAERLWATNRRRSANCACLPFHTTFLWDPKLRVCFMLQLFVQPIYKNPCVFYIFTTFSMKNYSWFISNFRLAFLWPARNLQLQPRLTCVAALFFTANFFFDQLQGASVQKPLWQSTITDWFNGEPYN